MILALDQGTTSSRAILFDARGNIIATAQQEFTQFYPHSGWVEHDAQEIWHTQLRTAQDVIAKAGINAQDIAAIGITNQRETTVVWDAKTGKPIYNAIVWQDRRTAPLCEQMKSDGWAERIKEKTGLVIDAYFSATKLRWILDNVPNAREKAAAGDLRFGTIDTWLIWNLTEGQVFATDASNASRTMLANIKNLRWDEDILTYLDIPECILPDILASNSFFGQSKAHFLGASIPIAGVAGISYYKLEEIITNTLDSWKKRSESEDTFSKDFAIAIDEIHRLWNVEMSHSKENKDGSGFSLSSNTRLGFINDAMKPLENENLIINLRSENRLVPKEELYERLDNLYREGDRYNEIMDIIKNAREGDEDAKTF